MDIVERAKTEVRLGVMTPCHVILVQDLCAEIARLRSQLAAMDGTIRDGYRAMIAARPNATT